MTLPASLLEKRIIVEENKKIIADSTFPDWTHSLIPESDKRDMYIGVVGKDLLWLESSAVPLIE